MKKLSSMVLASAILGGTTLFGAGIATLESVKGTPASLDAMMLLGQKQKRSVFHLQKRLISLMVTRECLNQPQ